MESGSQHNYDVLLSFVEDGLFLQNIKHDTHDAFKIMASILLMAYCIMITHR